MINPIRLGMLTPSSNTTLEPVTTEILAGLPETSAHFARFPVTEIALSDSALKQFDDTAILQAALLLAELEAELGIPIYDTISTVVWKSLRLAGADTARLTGWGSLFQETF
ncbi:hypothetical protein [Allohahella marinimesophila]|uniref:Asp/Glu/hydantoin racemase n=1 Tax=Allohahella marinimesophila TaxID=1054972 RepID=A0ABP7NSI5_9GAMM